MLVVPIADGRYGAYFERSRRVELEPGLTVDVVPDEPVARPRRADATEAMPDLALTQRERDLRRLRRRDAARKEERRAARTGRGRTAAVPALSAPRTFGRLRPSPPR